MCKWVDHPEMVINLDESQLGTIEQVEQFLAASAEVAFTAHGNDVERYAHIRRMLKRFDYPRSNKQDRGSLLRYLQPTSSYSPAQVTRLVTRWRSNRLASIPLIKRYRAPAAPFARKYTALDMALLVELDKAHEDVCGPAITHLLRRAFFDYGDARYERLAQLLRQVLHALLYVLAGLRYSLTRMSQKNLLTDYRQKDVATNVLTFDYSTEPVVT